MSSTNYFSNFMTNSGYLISTENENSYKQQQIYLKQEEQQDGYINETQDLFHQNRVDNQNIYQNKNQGELSYSVEQQRINHIKNLIDLSDQQSQQFGNSTSNSQQFQQIPQNQILSTNNDSHPNLNQGSPKSKKEILKEKREKKKLQVQEKKSKMSEEMSSNQMDSNDNKKEYTKEEKAERQKMKNRESAQISRDRKKQLENTIQEDLKFMTEENKQLQGLIKQHFKCQQCGYFNDPLMTCKSENTNTCYGNIVMENNKEKYFRQLSFNSIQNKLDNESVQEAKVQQDADYTTNNPVFQFFDFSKTNGHFIETSQNNISGYGKGVWNTSFIIFILYMMIVFAGQQTQENETFGQKFRNFQFVGPSALIFEQYKDLTQEQLLEELLNQIQKLNDSERQEQIQQLKTFQVIANGSSTPYTVTSEESYITTELNQSEKSSTIEESEKDFIIEESQSQASASTTATSIIMEKISALEKEFSTEYKPIQQNFLDFCKQYKEIQKVNENECTYYKELSMKLDELQKEKLMQLENLKQVYCPDTPSFLHQETDSQQYYQQEHYNSNKKQIISQNVSENNIISQNINSKILEQSSLKKLHNTVDQQSGNIPSNKNFKTYPSFENINQFFNDTASFNDQGRFYSPQHSSQNLYIEENKQYQKLEGDQHYYEQYQQIISKNKKYNKYQNDSDDSDNEEKNPFNIFDEEEDPYKTIPNVSTNKKSSINYYELMQKKSNDVSQQANHQQNQVFRKQPQQQKTNYFDEYQNQNITNSHKIQNNKNEKFEQFNLLLNSYQGNSNYYNNDSLQFTDNYDVKKYLKYSCKLLENNLIKNDKF